MIAGRNTLALFPVRSLKRTQSYIKLDQRRFTRIRLRTDTFRRLTSLWLDQSSDTEMADKRNGSLITQILPDDGDDLRICDWLFIKK